MNCAKRRPEGSSPVGCPEPFQARLARRPEFPSPHRQGQAAGTTVPLGATGRQAAGEAGTEQVLGPGQPSPPPPGESPAAPVAPGKGSQFELRPPKEWYPLNSGRESSVGFLAGQRHGHFVFYYDLSSSFHVDRIWKVPSEDRDPSREVGCGPRRNGGLDRVVQCRGLSGLGSHGP